MWNNLKAAFLLASMTGLLLGIGMHWRGKAGLTFAFVMAAVINPASYYFSDKIAIATSGLSA